MKELIDCPQRLFRRLGPLVGPALYDVYQRRDLCILSTRVVIDVGRYFGIGIQAAPVRAIVFNAAYATHVDNGDFERHEIAYWKALDGSHAVGVGFDPINGPRQYGWSGHLIAVAGGWFGDFSIQQAERLEHGIRTGAALVGEWSGIGTWSGMDTESGAGIVYHRIEDMSYLAAPDWRDMKRRKPVVGKLIRELQRA